MEPEQKSLEVWRALPTIYQVRLQRHCHTWPPPLLVSLFDYFHLSHLSSLTSDSDRAGARACDRKLASMKEEESEEREGRIRSLVPYYEIKV